MIISVTVIDKNVKECVTTAISMYYEYGEDGGGNGDAYDHDT